MANIQGSLFFCGSRWVAKWGSAGIMSSILLAARFVFIVLRPSPPAPLATVLTLSSTFLIAAVTAVLASSFTLNAMQTEVRTLDDLRSLQVGALSASTSSAILRRNGILHQIRPDLDSLVNDLDNGSLDAVVADAAFLQYRITQGKQQGQFKSLTVLPYEIEAQNYAFILAQDSPLRESINRALLSVRTQPEWRQKLAEYLGE